MGATDGRHYHALTDNVYRFIPYRLGPDDLARIHGINERVAIADVSASVRLVKTKNKTNQRISSSFWDSFEQLP